MSNPLTTILINVAVFTISIIADVAINGDYSLERAIVLTLVFYLILCLFRTCATRSKTTITHANSRKSYIPILGTVFFLIISVGAAIKGDISLLGGAFATLIFFMLFRMYKKWFTRPITIENKTYMIESPYFKIVIIIIFILLAGFGIYLQAYINGCH